MSHSFFTSYSKEGDSKNVEYAKYMRARFELGHRGILSNVIAKDDIH